MCVFLFVCFFRNESDEGGDPEKKKFQNQLSGQKRNVSKYKMFKCVMNLLHGFLGTLL